MNKKILTIIKIITLYVNYFLFRKENYVKFVIIARSRTGSNLLISLLNSNRKIRAFGEEFIRLGKNNCNTIYNEIFPKKSNKIIGFKIFYYHPIDSDDTSIWNMLMNDSNIKIIHLRRENLLRAHISHLIAAKSDKWISLEDNNIGLDCKKVQIDMDELFKDFETTNGYISIIKDVFQNHKMIEISYDDLVNEKEKTMENIFKFLNAPLISRSLKTS